MLVHINVYVDLLPDIPYALFLIHVQTSATYITPCLEGKNPRCFFSLHLSLQKDTKRTY